MPLPFRQRIFAILVALTAVPTALAIVGWALAVRTVAPSAGARVALEEVAASARLMVDRMDTTHLSPRERAAFREHLEQLSNSVTLARRAETYLRYYAGGFAAVVCVRGAFAAIAGVRVAGHLSRQLSRPIDELVGWTRLIRRRMPLPAGPPPRGAPEFEALRQALRELATALEAARERELEAERLRAFREVARRVAHEIKNPLTAMRIVVDQVGRTVGQADGRTVTAVEVLAAETMGGRGSIESAVSRDGNGLAVTIADHGAGIPDDLRQRVFEPYFTTKQDGTGLGLALVRQTIEAHKGSITVAETPGGGATFSIVLSAA